MPKYRHHLPQLDGVPFLTDSGLETTLIFHEGMELPHFASFDLMRDKAGEDRLRRYYEQHATIARGAGRGFILDTPTWRASRDWGVRLGYTEAALRTVNQACIEMMIEIRDSWETEQSPMVVSGNIGPRGDGYDPGAVMTPDAARAYHAPQIEAFAATEADMVTAMTVTNLPEAIGMIRASAMAGIPIALSFTVETDGCLPTGETLPSAIERVDEQTNGAAAYFMVNCAHPTHFADVLASDDAWTRRLLGVRVNASKCSHAELDQAESLDDGDPVELGRDVAAIVARLPHLNVLGGCCGTDHRHIEAIWKTCRAA